MAHLGLGGQEPPGEPALHTLGCEGNGASQQSPKELPQAQGMALPGFTSTAEGAGPAPSAASCSARHHRSDHELIWGMSSETPEDPKST